MSDVMQVPLGVIRRSVIEAFKAGTVYGMRCEREHLVPMIRTSMLDGMVPEERTCHMSEHNDLQPRGWYIHYWECSDCHAHYRDKDMPRFCPRCGARVVRDEA